MSTIGYTVSSKRSGFLEPSHIGTTMWRYIAWGIILWHLIKPMRIMIRILHIPSHIGPTTFRIQLPHPFVSQFALTHCCFLFIKSGNYIPVDSKFLSCICIKYFYLWRRNIVICENCGWVSLVSIQFEQSYIWHVNLQYNHVVKITFNHIFDFR